ncbi:ornithine cyclodeaminase [Microtetraspora sp. NBRC 13810]|uniref:ornithine cyclodeaminase family protein n=1 Tax=Microtetraspora sp. NBRC 13810 TaxID=3030990 RepID=UPI0024A39E58|nr:ornithine cyclodeaminase family protein [Microtetraspora sp. NBRC 13810]GLW08328.1 ornithine cyclodeaminase [Microtetraspora sp. NBRC 13810]
MNAGERETKAPPYIDGAELARLVPVARAVEVLEEALRGGLDPEDTPRRPVMEVPAGQVLLMPAAWRDHAGVKIATVAPGNPALGLPRIQGSYLLLDGRTLAPLALLDGIALTSLRTPAVSALAVRHLARERAGSLLVFGTGPQARGHVTALRAVRPVERVTVVGRDAARTAAFAARCAAEGFESRALAADDTAAVRAAVAEAELIACCTTARTPLFPGELVRDDATVVAVGSHEPGARELDEVLIARSTVFVEARTAALAEAGDLITPLRSGTITDGHLTGNMAELVIGGGVPATGPRVFKSVGMAWQDLVVAAAAYHAWAAPHPEGVDGGRRARSTSMSRDPVQPRERREKDTG